MIGATRLVQSEERLDDLLSTPRQATIRALEECPGDVIVLGAGGKMGPTLARMVRRAARDDRRVIAVSRFTSERAEAVLRRSGIDTVRCDLLDPEAVAQLPFAPNVIYMAGQKFGTAGAPSLTWMMNTVVPAFCADHFRGARIVAFSSGNVYPLTPVDSGGSREGDAVGPVGEYAASVVGRERVLEFFAERDRTAVATLRLNYAVELRYGVLTDLGVKLLRGEAIPLGMGYVNVIWQGDANRIAIESLPHAASPPLVLNVTGATTLSVREVAQALGERLGKTPRFSGIEQRDALLSNTDRLRAMFAPPEVAVTDMLDWVAAWLQSGGPLLGKPTKFESRDGTF